MRRLRLIIALGALLVAAGLMGADVAQASGEPVLRGISDPGLIGSWDRSGESTVREFRESLGADVVRINLEWDEAEPRRGVYDEDYLRRAEAAVRAVHERGMRAIVLVYATPRWASDRALWRSAAPGDRAGVWHSYYPPSLTALDAFGTFARQLSTRLRGLVLGYSCWVEPNLWVYLYPQRTKADPAFGARRYTRMLEAFSAGVRAGDPGAQVIAGETAPTGDDSRLRTSPQRFARQMQSAGAGRFFDAYAHHPYPVGGNRDIAPGAIPRDPAHTVWLANLGTLLDVFPGKPFYLTEFAYPTAPSRLFGVWVSVARQAAYLQASFRIAEQYDQVKLLLWFPISDWAENGSYNDEWGFYSGLRTLRGARKPAYYAYAGGNQLTLAAPTVVRAGTPLILRGRLTSERLGPLAGKVLHVRARRPQGSWVVVAKTRTRPDGSYAVRSTPRRSAVWQVRWAGVVDSEQAWVPVVVE